MDVQSFKGGLSCSCKRRSVYHCTDSAWHHPLRKEQNKEDPLEL